MDVRVLLKADRILPSGKALERSVIGLVSAILVLLDSRSIKAFDVVLESFVGLGGLGGLTGIFDAAHDTDLCLAEVRSLKSDAASDVLPALQLDRVGSAFEAIL